MKANMRIESGITIRESQIKKWLAQRGFSGEYLLVSTKPDSIYSKKLAGLKANQKLMVDLYTPLFLEKELTLTKWKPQDWVTRWRNKKNVKRFLMRGSHFLVANRRQREYWLGTSRKLGVTIGKNDISVVPTGAPRLPITNYRLPITNRKVVLWFGGIYPWMDPMPLVEGFGKIAKKFPDWKLRFLGGFHPDTGYQGRFREIITRTEEIIPKKQLEVIPWQEMKDLPKYLSDVAVAVHLVKPTKEDYFAHRVRLLSLLNSGIPVLTSGGDVISDLLIKKGAGERIKYRSDSVARVCRQLIKSSKDLVKMSQRAKDIQSEFIKQGSDSKNEAILII